MIGLQKKKIISYHDNFKFYEYTPHPPKKKKIPHAEINSTCSNWGKTTPSANKSTMIPAFCPIDIIDRYVIKPSDIFFDVCAL